MTTVFGVCALCHNKRELQDSHFLPKACIVTSGQELGPFAAQSLSAQNRLETLIGKSLSTCFAMSVSNDSVGTVRHGQ